MTSNQNDTVHAVTLGLVKYGDTSLISACYTLEYGTQSYMLKGILSKGKKKVSTVVTMREHGRFQVSFNNILKVHMDALSKRKKKMLEKLEEKKQKKARRAALFESLAASRIPTDQKKLFVPSSRMGQGETQKETLTRDLYFERAGLAALRQAEEVEKQDAKASAFVDEEQLMSKKKSRQVARKRRKLAKKAAKDAALAEAEQRRAEALANDSLSGSSSDDDDLGPAI